MQEDEVLKVAIAETSVIIRTGLALVLKRLQGLNILPMEIVSQDSLHDCIRLHRPDMLIINPAFPGYFDPLRFREEHPEIRCMALVCSVGDRTLLNGYDAVADLYDDPEQLREKLFHLLNMPEEESASGSAQEVLSAREKEIVTCVVRGMTNKEIADALFLSAHTVITHRRNIARKLQIHSPAGLTIYAIVNKLVELQEIADVALGIKK